MSEKLWLDNFYTMARWANPQILGLNENLLECVFWIKELLKFAKTYKKRVPLGSLRNTSAPLRICSRRTPTTATESWTTWAKVGAKTSNSVPFVFPTKVTCLETCVDFQFQKQLCKSHQGHERSICKNLFQREHLPDALCFHRCLRKRPLQFKLSDFFENLTRKDPFLPDKKFKRPGLTFINQRLITIWHAKNTQTTIFLTK